MTAEEWHARAAQSGFDGVPLTIGPGEYAELVRLRLAHDPLSWADHTADLDGVPLILDIGA